MTLQEIILRLSHYWAEQGCVLLPSHDMEMGAGTFHWATALKALGPDPWRTAYVQLSRRPTDGRYGDSPNRFQKFHQYQVLLKPAPEDSQDLYLQSLVALGISLRDHDIRFMEDNWESPTLGAWGLGWEVWCDGMEVSQFTYMQHMGGVECPVATELTYGLERLAMYLQNVDNVYDLKVSATCTYGELYKRQEIEFSRFNFEVADVQELRRAFEAVEHEHHRLLEKRLVLPAYECCVRASHMFNLLEARGVVSVAQRQAYVLRVRSMVVACAKLYLEDQGHG